MFYHLSGIVAETEPNLAVIDCGGVGYAVNMTHNPRRGVRSLWLRG